MNRTIKFRGKRVDNKGWAHGYYVVSDGRHFIFTGETRLSPITAVHKLMYKDFVRYEVTPETVGRLVCIVPNTSIYVDNSYELYEGDLIKPIQDNTVYKVVYNYNRFYGVSNESDKYGYFVHSLTEEKHLEILKVIGNIHDNPELYPELDPE